MIQKFSVQLLDQGLFLKYPFGFSYNVRRDRI
jgi:hypothetical protein